jgi:16S rRNA (cytosine1402-N4)-methyltransferase
MTTRARSPISESDGGHAPVLAEAVVSFLRPRSGGLYVDATVGAGGHSAALLAAGAGRVLGLDRDEAALARAADRLRDVGGQVELVHADYRDLPTVLRARGIARVAGVVADLGVSSMQLDDAARGFSFRSAGPLDMRMDRSSGDTLAHRLRDVDEHTLADVIFQFGEERHSRRIARAIVRARDREPITDTAMLASIVRRAAAGGRYSRIDPATRTFQALRIWVNGELDRLDAFVADAAAALEPGGRLAIIAFHSLEDRIVKHTMRRLAAERPDWTVVTRKPYLPADDEIARNPRARSARLRVLEMAA